MAIPNKNIKPDLYNKDKRLFYEKESIENHWILRELKKLLQNINE